MKDEDKDARLTAYSLGELDQTKCAALEAELRASPSMRETVEEIRQTEALLRAELAKEPPLYLSKQQRSEIENAIGEKGFGWFPRGWFLAAGGLAAAACLVMVVLLTSVMKHKSDGLMQAGPQLAKHESKEDSALKSKSPDVSKSAEMVADQPQLRRSNQMDRISDHIRTGRGREQDKPSNAAATTFDRKDKADELPASPSLKKAADTAGPEPLRQVAAAPPQPPKPSPAEEENAALKTKFAQSPVGSLTSARLKPEAQQSRGAGISAGVQLGHAGEVERKSVQPPPAQSPLNQAVEGNLISGAVIDAKNQSLSGAKMTIVDLKTGVSAHATSDDKGQFQIPGLPAGSFHIEVELAGFKKFSQDVVLHEGEKLPIDVKLLPVEKK